MAYETISSGITLTIPTSGTINWGPGIKSGAWQKISEHDHTGSGKGLKLGATSISANALDQTVISKNLNDYQVNASVAANAASVNWNNGRVHVVDMSSSTGDVTVTVSNPATGARYLIKVISHATNKLILAGGTFKWPQGQDPTDSGEYLLSLASGDIDILEFYYDGSSYLANWNVGFA